MNLVDMTGVKHSRESKKKILAVHRYYWPDTAPYASMLKRIVSTWKDCGHDVSVLSSQPSYKSNVKSENFPKVSSEEGIEVVRLPLPNESSKSVLRLLNAFHLGFKLFWRALVNRYDAIMISTYPPVIGGVTAAIAAKLTKAQFIYHCMDIHPEVGRVSGEFSNPFVFKLLAKLDNWSCKRADPVIVLSEDMKETLLSRRDGGQYRIQVLNNFSLPSDSRIPEELPFDWPEASFTVLFAGNVGRFQGLETAIEAMGQISQCDDIAFVIMGEGRAKRGLQELAKKCGARVFFVGHQPVEVAKAAMRKASMGFVSLTAGIYRYAYPSKTMTYLEQGCPVIVAVEAESELARDVVSGNFGCVVPPEDIKALAELLLKLAGCKNKIAEMRIKAHEKFQSDFSEAKVLRRWENIITPKGF